MTPRPRPKHPAQPAPARNTGRSAKTPAQRSKNADRPRVTAYAVLRAVTDEDAYANLLLPGRLARAGLTGRDAAFATEITYGTLRGRGLYDAVIAACTDRGVDDIEPALLDALRMGAHQLMNMRVGAHAAVDSSVALVRTNVGVGPSKFANAVLRRIAEADRDAWLETVTRDLTGNKAAAIRYSHPAWIVRALRQALIAHGRDAAEIEDLLAADNTAARPTLAALPGLTTPDELIDGGAAAGDWSPVGATAASGAPGDIPQVADGTARIQDEGSQLAALALLEARPARTDERWLDLCAGPGGKAALLAAHGAQDGARLTAVEISDHRAGLVDNALEPISGDHTVEVADGTEFGLKHPASFDRVLVDVPCTGLGALRRRPEARWRRSPADIAALGPVQRGLVHSAVAAAGPGGLIGFVTCSPHPAETLAVVDDVLKAHPELTVLDAPAVLGRIASRNVDAASAEKAGGRVAQLWPHVHGTDGMFIALFEKPADDEPARANR